MDRVNQVVAIAERVVLLRGQLSEAETRLRQLVGVAGRQSAPSPQPAGPSVAQRVRDLLHDGRKALGFGEIVRLTGDRPQAARAALKKLRAAKHVRFAGGKYSWAGK